MTDQLLDIPEVARRLKVSQRTVWMLLQSHQLESVHLGRARRVRESALDRFVSELTLDGGS